MPISRDLTTSHQAKEAAYGQEIKDAEVQAIAAQERSDKLYGPQVQGEERPESADADHGNKAPDLIHAEVKWLAGTATDAALSAEPAGATSMIPKTGQNLGATPWSVAGAIVPTTAPTRFFKTPSGVTQPAPEASLPSKTVRN